MENAFFKRKQPEQPGQSKCIQGNFCPGVNLSAIEECPNFFCLGNKQIPCGSNLIWNSNLNTCVRPDGVFDPATPSPPPPATPAPPAASGALGAAQGWVRACKTDECKNNCPRAMAISHYETGQTFNPSIWEEICPLQSSQACNTPSSSFRAGKCAYGLWQIDCSNSAWTPNIIGSTPEFQANLTQGITNDGSNWEEWATLCTQPDAKAQQQKQTPTALNDTAETYVSICQTAGMPGPANSTFTTADCQ